MRIFHNAYGLGTELNMRIKVGYDNVNLSKMDELRVLEETQTIRGSKLGGLIQIWAKRIVFDFRTAFENRHDLDIRVYDIPYLLIVSPAVRTLALGSAILTLIKPNYFREKFGW